MRRSPRFVHTAFAIIATVLAASHASGAPTVTWIPGNSREIARTTSASRNTPVSALVFAPRVRAMGAADFAFVSIDFGDVALRPGMDAFFELEHAETGTKQGTIVPLPGLGNGPMLWRGMYRASLALDAHRFARRWLGEGGALEIVGSLGHESDHVTGASFDDAPNRGDILAGGGGEFLVEEIALRFPLSPSLHAWMRMDEWTYLRGAIRHAPSFEAGLRWRATEHLRPFVSLFGQALLVDHGLNEAKNGGFAALLAGVSLHGTAGQLLPFVSIDVGNGRGLLINRHELRVSIGVRYAPF